MKKIFLKELRAAKLCVCVNKVCVCGCVCVKGCCGAGGTAKSERSGAELKEKNPTQ